MKLNPCSLLALSGLVTVWSTSAQVPFPDAGSFGVWHATPASETAEYETPPEADRLEVGTVFSAEVSFTPHPDTPEHASYTYTITYNSIVLELSTGNGILAGESGPIQRQLGPVSVDYFVADVGVKSGGVFSPIPVSIGPFTKDFVVGLTPVAASEQITVTWVSLSSVSVTGGKGVDGVSDTPALSGNLPWCRRRSITPCWRVWVWWPGRAGAAATARAVVRRPGTGRGTRSRRHVAGPNRPALGRS